MKHFILVVLLAITTFKLIAQNDVSLCQGETFANQEVFARYDSVQGRLVIVSWNTGEILREFISGQTWEEFYVIGWSSQCHYLVLEINHQTIVWQVETPFQIGILATIVSREPSRHSLRIDWSPNEQFLVLQTLSGAYLWDLATNTQVLLTNQLDNNDRSLVSVGWDMVRNELLIVKVDTANGITVYNLENLQELYFLHIGNRREPVRYAYSGNTMIVYSSVRAWGFARNNPIGLAIWNRQDGIGLQLNPDDERFSLLGGFEYEQISDYLILNTTGYFTTQKLYIWDTNNLIGSEPYIPNYVLQNSVAGAEAYRVLSGDILEVADWTYWAYSYEPATVRIVQVDLSNQEISFRTPRISYQLACENANYMSDYRASIDWACSHSQYTEPTYWGTQETRVWPQ